MHHAWADASLTVPIVAAVVVAVVIVALFVTSSSSSSSSDRGGAGFAGVPFAPGAVPLFGHTFRAMACLERMSDTVDRVYRLFPEARACGYYQMQVPHLIVRDPALVTAVLIKDFAHFTDHGMLIDPAVNMMARALFFANGQKWRAMRQRLSPGFTSGKLKAAHGQIRECADRLADTIVARTAAASGCGGDGGIDACDAIGNLATDVIGACAFGMKLDTMDDENSDFRVYVKKLLAPGGWLLLINALSMMAPRVVRFLRLRAFHRDASDFFQGVFRDVLRYRADNNIVRNDLAQTLIEARNELVGQSPPAEDDSTTESAAEQFCELDIIANATLLFAAGTETVTFTASYCLYELALNMDIQNRLREEINSVKEKYDGDLSNDFLMDLHYADMVLDETHRKYSIAWNLMRVATKKYNVPGESLIIEKGQKVIIPMYSIHHDPKYYPDPDVFDPERFSVEEKSKRPNGTFLPFGDGPRHCIGKRFAELELKFILAKILLKYEVLTCEKTEIPIKMKISPGLFSPENGVWLKFKNIQS